MQNNYILIVKYPSIKPMIKLWRLFHKRTTYNVQFIECIYCFSLIGERISQQAIGSIAMQLIGDPRYLRFNVLIREDAKV
jgi:hypothetical protein